MLFFFALSHHSVWISPHSPLSVPSLLLKRIPSLQRTPWAACFSASPVMSFCLHPPAFLLSLILFTPFIFFFMVSLVSCLPPCLILPPSILTSLPHFLPPHFLVFLICLLLLSFIRFLSFCSCFVPLTLPWVCLSYKLWLYPSSCLVSSLKTVLSFHSLSVLSSFFHTHLIFLSSLSYYFFF